MTPNPPRQVQQTSVCPVSFAASQNNIEKQRHVCLVEEGSRAIMCLWIFLYHLCAISLTLACMGNVDAVQSPMKHPIDEENDTPGLVFSKEWRVLGPFAIGTRGNSDRIKA